MLHKTKGIVFRYTPYGETSIIVNIFTESFGLQSYIVNSVRSKTGKGKIAIYQPLTLLDLVVYHKENAGILRIKEATCAHPYHTVQSDPRKSCIGMFINEVLNKSVKEQVHADELCNFIFDSLIRLDALDHPENFHLIFLIKLSKYLGFGPFAKIELGALMLNDEEEIILDQLLVSEYEDDVKMRNDQRRILLDAFVRFYGNHIDSMGSIKSVQVLREILS
ncbi:MAG: DNA repair protein RecO [Cyclobacteriaceae bacterium]|jgi:DNA repair protein RecO (recombination protein O)|nr:DNA repair protein RecO [Cyclobacteriaceae bacterium]